MDNIGHTLVVVAVFILFYEMATPKPKLHLMNRNKTD